MEASPTHIQNNNHVTLSRIAMHFDLTLLQYSQFAAAILWLLGGQGVLVDRTSIIVSSPKLSVITACKEDNDKCKISS